MFPFCNIKLGKQGSFQAVVCLFGGIWSPGERLGAINPLPCLLFPETGRHRAPWLTSFKMIEVGEKDRAPCPRSCGSLEEREVWGRMGPCVCMAESLHYSPEGITTLLIGCVCVCVCVCVRTHMLGHVRLFATPWMVAHQASLSMGLSRQEHWSGNIPIQNEKFF